MSRKNIPQSGFRSCRNGRDYRDYRNLGDYTQQENSGYIDPEEYRKSRYLKSIGAAEESQRAMADDPMYNGENGEPVYLKKSFSQPVLLLQTILCLAAAIALFAVKSIGGNLYDTVKEYYQSFLSYPDVITEFFSENELKLPSPTDKVLTDSTSYESQESTSEEGTENATENTADSTAGEGGNYTEENSSDTSEEAQITGEDSSSASPGTQPTDYSDEQSA